MLENEFEVVVPLSYIENLIRENQELKDKLIASKTYVSYPIIKDNIDANKIADELTKKINMVLGK